MKFYLGPSISITWDENLYHLFTLKENYPLDTGTISEHHMRSLKNRKQQLYNIAKMTAYVRHHLQILQSFHDCEAFQTSHVCTYHVE